MQDSPLSIAASIAGLLTLAVALFGSIYIRVITLASGNKEMREAAQTVSYIQEEMKHVQIQFESRPEFDHIKETLNGMLKIGQEIIDQFAHVKRTLSSGEIIAKALGIAARFPIAAACWSMVVFSVSMATGMTPSLLRWYKVRDRILQRTRKWEIYRNRLVFYQIALVSLQVASQQTAIDQLLQENKSFRSTLEEMNRHDRLRVEL